MVIRLPTTWNADEFGSVTSCHAIKVQQYCCTCNVYIITILPSIEDTVRSNCQLGQILDVGRPEAAQLVICDTYTCE